MMKQFLSACIISVALSLSATPEWLGNTLGLEHEVPTPFENVRIPPDKSHSNFFRPIR